jgi:hypothetical protein
VPFPPTAIKVAADELVKVQLSRRYGASVDLPENDTSPLLFDPAPVNLNPVTLVLVVAFVVTSIEGEAERVVVPCPLRVIPLVLGIVT